MGLKKGHRLGRRPFCGFEHDTTILGNLKQMIDRGILKRKKRDEGAALPGAGVEEDGVAVSLMLLARLFLSAAARMARSST
jgi:hypothetical protein